MVFRSESEFQYLSRSAVFRRIDFLSLYLSFSRYLLEAFSNPAE